jgi:hypothetical protein
MLGGMGVDAAAVEGALATVQRVLDALTARAGRGQHEAAYEIARAQFAASVRASWPANLSAVAQAIERALADAAVAIPDEERDALRRAADVLRAVPHP